MRNTTQNDRDSTFVVDDKMKVVFIHHLVNPTVEHCIKIMEAALSHPQYRQGFAFLIDRTTVEAPTTHYIESVVQFLKRHASAFDGSRIAVVVKDPASFGMLRMAQFLTDGRPCPIEIFKDQSAAEEWIRKR